MRVDKYDVSDHLTRSAGGDGTSRKLPDWLSGIRILLALGAFAAAVFAGAMFSGIAWGHSAHAWTARVLTLTAVIATCGAFIVRRRTPQGQSVVSSLLSFAILIVLQSAVGALSARGTNLLWFHIPLGVALFGFAWHSAVEVVRHRTE